MKAMEYGPLTTALCVLVTCCGMVRGGETGQSTPGSPTPVFGSEIEIGGFYPAISTTIRLDSATREAGTKVKFEDDLDFSDRKFLPSFLATWRISDRWLVQLDYVNLDRSNTKVLEKEIRWPPGEGGETFQVGVATASFLDFSDIRVAGAYIFRTANQSELALLFGVHLTRMAAGIGLLVDIGGEGDLRAADMELPYIPLPTFGLYWGTRIGEQWKVRLRGDFFALAYDDYSGSLISARADVSYHLASNWAVGLGMNFYKLSLEAKKPRFTGEAVFSYWGPNLFGAYTF
jgi:hypothetical protein